MSQPGRTSGSRFAANQPDTSFTESSANDLRHFEQPEVNLGDLLNSPAQGYPKFVRSVCVSQFRHVTPMHAVTPPKNNNHVMKLQPLDSTQ